MDCVCRKEAKLLGNGCDHPIETCLSFGVAAEYYIENEMGRKITANEAIQIIKYNNYNNYFINFFKLFLFVSDFDFQVSNL